MASLWGGRARNKGEKEEAARNRQFQAGQTQKGMAFAERMRNTSWQAGVADMEAAGLNPALAYAQGGAASPGGMAGSGSKANINDAMSPAVSSGIEAKRLGQELENMKAQEDATYARNKLDTNLAEESAYRTQMIERQQKGQEITNKLAGLSLFSARNLAGLEKTKLGKVLPYAERILGMAPRINLGAILGGGARRGVARMRPNQNQMTTMQRRR